MVMRCDFLKKMLARRIVLASGSPRRRELLSQLGVGFVVESLSDVDESRPANTSAILVAPVLAKRKADAYRQEHGISDDKVVISADTVVVVDDEVLGKPADAADARRMLALLSGRTHKVVTGVVVESSDYVDCQHQITEVTFAQLSENEIDYYVEHYRPMDKAGAYGIQEWIGYIGIEKIDGDYYNVMGLPLRLLYTMLCNPKL